MYDDAVAMGRLAQAFGRLIRRANDRGCFVLIGPAVPSRLLGAFPPGTPIDRMGLDDAAAAVAAAHRPLPLERGQNGLPESDDGRHGIGNRAIGELE